MKISSLCNFLHSAVTFCLLDENIIISIPYSNILNLCLFGWVEIKFDPMWKEQDELILYFVIHMWVQVGDLKI